MNKTKKITTLALLCALSYIAMFASRFLPPLFSAFPFLKYDPKDVVIVIGGFIYGPLAAFSISLAVSIFEMISVSGTHIIGCLMNVASTCAFACTASVIYTKYRSIRGGGAGLAAGSIACVTAMMILNYLLTPIYMGMPRAAVADILVPAILPFNVIKCVLNSALTLIIYKPISRILKRSGLVESTSNYSARHSNIAVLIVAVILILSCSAAIYIVNRG